jgi:hypothetical protein
MATSVPVQGVGRSLPSSVTEGQKAPVFRKETNRRHSSPETQQENDMNKWILALAAFSTLTSVSAITSMPASAQSNCLTFACPDDTPKGGSTASCDSQLGHLRRVYKPQVAGIDDRYQVWVTELCSSFSMLRNEGNAAYLRPTIAANDVLVEMLGRKDYRPADVFAVQMMGDDTINLYVHRFGR